MIELECRKCGATVKQDPKRIIGCLCDPDAPTWIAIQPDGRLITMSHADYARKDTND